MVIMQEQLNVRQKREAYAHRSLIDLFTAKGLPAKAHTFAKNFVGTDFLLIFNPSKFTDYTRGLQDLNEIHFIEIIAQELRSLFSWRTKEVEHKGSSVGNFLIVGFLLTTPFNSHRLC